MIPPETQVQKLSTILSSTRCQPGFLPLTILTRLRQPGVAQGGRGGDGVLYVFQIA